MAKKKTLHPSLKKTLGYAEEITDKEFLKDWKHRTSQVCKPCWELKYCPYGPFVEQSPILPSLRKDAIEHNQYLLNCLESGMTGSIINLSADEIYEKEQLLEIVKEHNQLLLIDIFRDIDREERIKEGIEKNLQLHELYQAPYSEFEKYKVPFPLDEEENKEEMIEQLMGIEITPDLRERIDKKIFELETCIETRTIDHRKELDPIRKKYFEESTSKFNPEDFPEIIPEIIQETSCNIFGHICPVVFVGESITETSEKRRRGRYISFKTKVRVVRRDNYTCQECSKHLKDDEVEFDHIIPHSKGGSSEEHNIRLTCYDCNRDKLDSIQI